MLSHGFVRRSSISWCVSVGVETVMVKGEREEDGMGVW